VEREIRRRVPDFQVIVAFSQAHPYQHQGSEDGDGGKQSMLLNEAALRLLWLYHRTLPSLAAEARFDVGKLVMNLVIHSSRSGEEEGDAMDVDSGDDFVDAKGLAVIGHLHVLRILKESDSFSWSSKLGSISFQHTYFAFPTDASPSSRVALHPPLPSSETLHPNPPSSSTLRARRLTHLISLSKYSL
jgi:nucleolar pre-ribosomal-associated protein 1